MDYAVFTGAILVIGVPLALIAQWRDWRPPLIAAIGVGIAVRVLLMYTAAEGAWQPVDFVNSFKPAGEAVLRGEDPVLASNGGWHFLPTIPYVYGILLWFGIPWEYAGRLVTVVADIVLIPLVAKLAGGPKASLRAFQYALNPLALLVASIHGQVEPVALVFGVAAFVVARGPGSPERVGVTDSAVARFRLDVLRDGRQRGAPAGARHAAPGAEADPVRPGRPQARRARRPAHGPGAVRQELADLADPRLPAVPAAPAGRGSWGCS